MRTTAGPSHGTRSAARSSSRSSSRSTARTRAIVAPLAVLGLVATAACGSTQAAQQEATAGSTGGSSAPAAATKTISTVKGDVQVPTQPQRVVSLYNTTAELLDLGITPVGVLAEAQGDYAPADWEKLSTIPTVGENEMSINYEQLVALKPDLIISTQRRDEDFGYAKLAAIAPTVFMVTDNPAEVRDALPKIAQAVGKEAQAAQKASQLEAKIAAVKAEHADVLSRTTWDYVEGGPEGFVANSPVSWPGLWMEKAGLKFSAVANSERENRGVRLSYEQIGQLGKTSAIFTDADPAGKPGPDTAKLLDQSAWKLLPAVKAGHVYDMKYSYQYSYKGVNAIVDQIDQTLDAVGGSSASGGSSTPSASS